MLLPMSPLDSMFLLGESREHPLHVGGVQIFQPPEGADARDMRALLDTALTDGDRGVAPQLGKRARRSWTSLGQWGWEMDSRLDLGHHVRHDALPEPGGEAQLWALCARLHSALLDRSRPLWETHLIEGLRDGRYAMYTKMHHAVADGVSAMSMLRRTLSEDPDERGMPAPWQPPHPRPAGPATDAVGTAGAADLPRAAVRTARGAVGELAGLVPALAGTLGRAARDQGGPLSLTAPRTIFNEPISGARQFAARSWPLERLRLVAKAADATINDVVLAMSAGALRSYLHWNGALPAQPLIAMVPVSLRDEQQGSHGGNGIGVLMYNLGTHLPDPAARLNTVRTCMREGKQALAAMSTAQILAMSALGAAPAGASMLFGHHPRLRPPFNLIISNVPGPRRPLYWNGARLDAVYPLSIPVDGQGLNITCTSNDDIISFGITGCRRTVPHLHTLTAHLGHELDALEHAVGL
ncbi:wax ester/triacylglycerol synthase family O-acyltransferase [Rhodococcus sp. ACS1]|uniref:WS/DGAT/MGAT family O-acyltransferase n=1 Tax=Rhodococcus sp. ACS1 TaxID=2028570 RepID=UPI000BB0D3FD|nr:wax ester/triacylglycerol synthase family O-acyltransferase [Rhodococcus sp. ACS1]PBC39122.1 wax ester/triacylglycerol synthase family O-acyltransferase [Rhodococcus sp. ACS1]